VAAPFPGAGEAAAVASSLLWAVGGVLFARVGRGVSGVALNLGKNAVAVACFAVLLLVTEGAPWPRNLGSEQTWLLVASGVLGLTICDTLLMASFLRIGPRRANLYVASTPVLLALLAMLPPLSEHPPARTWLGMAVCLAGIVLAILERSPDPVRRAEHVRGAREALLAALFQALGLLIARHVVRSGRPEDAIDPAAVATVRLAAGTAGLVVVGIALGRLRSWTAQLAVPGAGRRVVVAAFVGTFLGLWVNMAGITWATYAGVATTLSALPPVFLIPLSAAFLGERHDRRAWISTLLALAGIALMAT
jgi:drug/metabolite transporter (DMT)-like permease